MTELRAFRSPLGADSDVLVCSLTDTAAMEQVDVEWNESVVRWGEVPS